MCTEQILIKTGGELSQHLARVVTPLLIHDLPVVLWWPDDPPFGSRQFNEVVGTADRLLVDSGSFNEDGGKRMAGLATVVANGVSVTDIGWLRLNLWRELLAGDVRSPAARPGAGPHQERAHRRGPANLDAARLQGRLLPGLACSRLGWEVARPLTEDAGEDEYLHGAFRRGKREIEVELRPVRSTLDGAQRAAGSLVARRHRGRPPARHGPRPDHAPSRTICSQRPTGTARRFRGARASSSRSTRHRSSPRRSTRPVSTASSKAALTRAVRLVSG